MGYFAKKQKARKTSIFIFISTIFLAAISSCGLFEKNNSFCILIDEYRLQFILISTLLAFFALIKKRFYASIIFGLIAGFNFWIIVSENDILVEEYAGKNPTVFSTLVHKMEQNHDDYNQVLEIIKNKNPKIAILFLNNKKLEKPIKNFKNTVTDSLENGESIQILSNYSHTKKVSLFNKNDEKIGFAVDYNKFKRPITLIVTSLSNRMNLKNEDNIEDLNSIIDFVKSKNNPVMIVGGFNNNPWSNIFDNLKSAEFSTQSGLYPDYNSILPLPFRISSNYIFSNPGISIFDIEILEKTNSDYLPQLFTIAIKRKKR